MNKLRLLKTKINSYKGVLVDKVKQQGLYENFGRKEVRILEDEFIDLSDYSPTMNQMRDEIDAFSEWCGWYSPED